MIPSIARIGRRQAGSALSRASASTVSASASTPTTWSLSTPVRPWACSSCVSRYFSNTPAASGSSSSNTRWQARQSKDMYAREAKVKGLKSRAAFKLLEIDQRHRLFKPNQTIVDLGYAPGSWSQVAVERTKPHGRVVGIDLIPAQPPRGVSTIQGNFLSPVVRDMVKELLARPATKEKMPLTKPVDEVDEVDDIETDETETEIETKDSESTTSNDTVDVDRLSYLDERQAPDAEPVRDTRVDIVLSDMSAPWPQTHGFWLNTLSNPYRRMMNTSGNAFRDHAGSMDLCLAALEFASDTLRTGGHFVCKFYQGGEDKAFEMRLKKIFTKVVREKPGSSRSESKEAFFVALRKKKGVKWDDIKDM